MTNTAEAIAAAKHASAEVPEGARARVWRRLQSKPAPAGIPAWAKGLAFAACTAAGFLAVSALTAPAKPIAFTLDGAVASVTGDAVRGDDGVIAVSKGHAVVSAWASPGVTLRAQEHRIEAEVALFSVDVAPAAVTVDVREGEVRVDGEKVMAGKRWPSGTAAAAADFTPVAKLEPARAQEDRAWSLAEQSARTGDYPQAVKRFDALGGGRLRAEAALLRKGELQLRELSSPADALKTFDHALQRFPHGSLTQELALSSLEATLALGQWTDARTRATDFLARFPQSERLQDVRYVSALAAWQLNDKSTTCAEIRNLQTAAFHGERRATLEKLAAQCTLFER